MANEFGLNFPPPDSAEELRYFEQLQNNLVPQFERIFSDSRAPRTVVVLPSLSLDPDELKKITGVSHYEERMLCMLMLLRLPRTRLIYLTSESIDPTIIDYYLHLLPGIPSRHARSRLTLLSCQDASPLPLSEKILSRPRLLARIREAITDPTAAHITCFSATSLERTLAVRLGIPLYGCDPALNHLGNKSGSREIFRNAEVLLPAGFEHLRDAVDISSALVDLKRSNPKLQRAVVKLNEGFSGEGNALFDYAKWDGSSDLQQWVTKQLPTELRFEAKQENWENYEAKFARMGGIVECFVEGSELRSPSVQCRIDPTGKIELISSHEQVLGGPSGQIFLGSQFPAHNAYRQTIQQASLRIAEELRQRGILGRFAVDFIAARCGDDWNCYAIEINLRKGGTTHTYMMLQFLTDGHYDSELGLHLTASGQPRYYRATDNLQNSDYRGLTADDLIDIAVNRQLHFHGASQQGVVFHLIGALSEFGKLGMVCVAENREEADALYTNTIVTIDREVKV